MSRYLTPSKIALLCLISVYTDGVVPNSSAIDVLSFLMSCLSPLGSDASSSLNRGDSNYIVAIDDLEDALSSKASSIPGRSIWDLFLKKIWSIDSCDALEVFFTEISDILVKSREEQIRDRDNGLAPETGRMRLSRCSPLGAFVRRAQLEFTRLQFHDSVKLWKGFVHYRLPTYRVWSKKNPSTERDPVDINLLELNLDSTSHLAQVAYGNIEMQEEDGIYVSTKDVERLLEFQIGELQSTQTSPLNVRIHDAHLLTECRTWRKSPRRHEGAARTYHGVWRRNTQPDLLPKVRWSSRTNPPSLTISDSSMHGELETTLHPSTIFTDILTIQCIVVTGAHINMRCSTSQSFRLISDAMEKLFLQCKKLFPLPESPTI